MSIDSAVAFTLRNDEGKDQTLWLGFESFEGVQETLAEGLSTQADVRSETVANIVTNTLSNGDYLGGLSFSRPPGITHTIHTFNFNDETVVLTDPDSGQVKVTLPFKNFLARHGF